MSKMKKLNLPTAGGVGCCLAVLMTVLLCIPGAAVINKGILPLSASSVWACAAAGVSVFLVVLVLARLRKRQAMPLAGIIAGGFVLLAAILCAFGGASSAFGPWLWSLAITAAAGGLLGAVMSIRHNTYRKHRR